MLGLTKIAVSIPLYKQLSLLVLTGDSTPVLLSVGGAYYILSYCLYVTQSDKTSLIAGKYTHPYNGIYLLFCV